MARRAYDSIRTLVEGLGGSMFYQRKGYRYGVWVIRIDETSIDIPAEGDQAFPHLDGLLAPLVERPQHWCDYSCEMVPDAKARLLAMLRHAGDEWC